LKNREKTKLKSSILWRHRQCKKDARKENVVAKEEQLSTKVSLKVQQATKVQTMAEA
jgi:hypothetical protein